jgi:ABC-type Na+ efflux pump permease subunit
VVAEREKRSLDLLMALPVSVADILLAKLRSMLVLAAVVVLPPFAIDMTVQLALGLSGLVRFCCCWPGLLAALACPVRVVLLLAPLARDFRSPTICMAPWSGR